MLSDDLHQSYTTTDRVTHVLMEKCGCNHLVIAGILDDDDFSKADFLAMHLEQHLDYEIRRDGRLPEQWDYYYRTVLEPLQITSDTIKEGKLVVFTREGRLIGGFADLVDIVLKKYGVEIEYPPERIQFLKKASIEKAKNDVRNGADFEFNDKVDLFLKKRKANIQDREEQLLYHEIVLVISHQVNNQLDSLDEFLKPLTADLVELHHYPPPPEEDESAVGAESGEPAEQAEATNSEEEENSDAKTSLQELPTKSSTNVDPSTSTGEDSTTEPGDEELANQPAEAQEAPNPEEEEDQKEQVSPEEEDFETQEADVLELAGKLQENFKLPPFGPFEEYADKLKEYEYDIHDILVPLKEDSEKIKGYVSAEKFRWKRLEKTVLRLVDNIKLVKGAISLSVEETENSEIKKLKAELFDLTEFIFPDEDPKVVEAASIKFCATFNFI